MTSNISSNNRIFLNTPPPLNGDMFKLWKVRIKIFPQSINLELWEK